MTAIVPRCLVDGCSRAYYAKGYCQTHYARQRRHGTVADPVYAKDTPCTVPGCHRVQHAKGLCDAHRVQADRVKNHEQRNREAAARMRKFMRDQPERYAFLQIRGNAKARGKAWALSRDEVTALITAPCHYCGTSPKWPQERSGIDRTDNARGYEPGNCVPCCASCNSAKGTRTVVEFEAWARRLHMHLTQRRTLRAV